MEINDYLNQIVLPKIDSHKGENGRVLVIGGSKLFHAAAFWSATMASKVVDLVHFTSPAMENNDLMRIKAKEKFWDGIVIPWENVKHYIEEDDCILIGPGMPRDEGLMDGEKPTGEIVNELLKVYPDKKWVVDGGALQEVSPEYLSGNMIITPNKRELEMLIQKTGKTDLVEIAKTLKNVTILAKGVVDRVTKGDEIIEIEGGNAGMTKGGTGDVLAGLLAGLYAKSPQMAAAVSASKVNKMAGEKLAVREGTFYSAANLIPEVTQVLHTLIS